MFPSRHSGHVDDQGEVTRLLGAAQSGDAQALNRVVTLVYRELEHLAHRQLAKERPDHTLDTGALVHEAFLKVSALHSMQWQSREHFLAMSARLMRRILVDYAAAKRAQKRGGDAVRITLEPDLGAATGSQSDDLLALDEALQRLATLDPRQARVVECRFFAGMSVEETATALEISPATVKRDWVAARAWLNAELDA
jgi:RNA polymerase sigma factor (TIGR02999 family)